MLCRSRSSNVLRHLECHKWFFIFDLIVFTPRPNKAFGACLSVHTFHQHNISSMHSWRKVICYLIMLLWGGQEAHWLILFLVKMAKILRNCLEGINTLSHQCIAEECWNTTLLCPLGLPRSQSKGSDIDLFFVENGEKLWNYLRASMH